MEGELGWLSMESFSLSPSFHPAPPDRLTSPHLHTHTLTVVRPPGPSSAASARQPAGICVGGARTHAPLMTPSHTARPLPGSMSRQPRPRFRGRPFARGP